MNLSLILALCIFLAVDLILWNRLVKNCQSFALKVAFVFASSTKMFAVTACISLAFSGNQISQWHDTFLQGPFEAALGASAINLTVAFLVFATKPFFENHVSPITMELFKRADSSFELFLIFAGLLNLFYWVAITEFSNSIFFIARRLDGALGFVPFVVGLTAFQFKKALLFWLFVFAIQIAIAIATGSRGQAFIPLALFLVGLTIGLPNWRTRFRIGWMVLLPTCCLLAMTAVYIGIARDIVGRTDLAGALTSGTLSDRISQNQFDNAIGKAGNVIFETSNRLASWPPLVVPILSPDRVPFRGFDDFDLELAASTNIRIGSGQTSGPMYLPNIYLKPFGFAVHVGRDGVAGSSVEISSFVDGYTRGGWLIGFLYCAIAYSVLMIVDNLARRILFLNNVSLYTMLLVVISNPLRYMDSGLIIAVRLLILDSIMCLVVFFVFTRLVNAPPRIR